MYPTETAMDGQPSVQTGMWHIHSRLRAPMHAHSIPQSNVLTCTVAPYHLTGDSGCPADTLT